MCGSWLSNKLTQFMDIKGDISSRKCKVKMTTNKSPALRNINKGCTIMIIKLNFGIHWNLDWYTTKKTCVFQ